jgi:hypothetical protein
MIDFIVNGWHEILARPEGPMAFRFYLQPLMAITLAVIDGIKDARAGQLPFLWALASDPLHRHERWVRGWKSISRVFVLALALDVIYEILVLHALRPLQSLLIATVLALVPYMLVSGPACRIARVFVQRSRARHA